VIADQIPDVAELLAERCSEVHAVAQWQGRDFMVVSRAPAVGGQLLDIQVDNQRYSEVFLPLFGAHQAGNAATALAATQAAIGHVSAEVVEVGFAEVTSPGRLHVLRRNPAVIADAAHNPHGLLGTLDGLQESFDPQALVVVFGALADKDVRGMLRIIGERAQSVVLCLPRSPRAMNVEELRDIAVEELGADRVHQADDLSAALDQAVTLVEQEHPYGGGVVLVTGSVVLAGEAVAAMAGKS